MRKSLFTMVLYLTLILVCSVGFLLYLNGHHLKTDKTPPTIAFPEEMLELSVKDPREALLQGVSATDDRDGDVTASLVVAQLQMAAKDGTVRVTYAAFDAAGNVTKAVRKVKYTDYESPRIRLQSSLTFAVNSRFDLFNIVTAQDLLDGDISHRVRITSLDNVNITTQGTHQVQVSVSNALGQTVSLVLPVEIYAAGTYEANLALTDYLVYLPVGAKLDVNSYLASYSRAGSTLSLENGIPEDYALDIRNNVQTRIPGVYTVEYRVTETVNGKNYTGYAKLIVVVEG